MKSQIQPAVPAEVGQAIVRFMAEQYVERDGRRQRFIAGVWGIFGHGNVAGLGQALEELGDACEMPYYRPQNEQAQVHLAAAFAKHRNRLQTFADRFRAKNTKASQAQSKLKQIERMEKIAAPEPEAATIDFRFPQPPQSGLKTIRLRDVRHAYGETVVYRGIDFQAERGQRGYETSDFPVHSNLPLRLLNPKCSM